ncbi:MAG: CapA family protein [Anaerolineales bacterium]|jgi:poly-gamma-glutamate synthesis protein (capsule biosynthesis protein)
MKRTRLIASLIPALVMLAACGVTAPSATPTSSQSSAPSPTAFQPETITPTPAPLTLWLSPGLPQAISDLLQGVTQAGGFPVQIVDQSDEALVRAEPGAEVQLSSWVFVAAGAFPMLDDEISVNDLQALWNGSGRQKLYASPTTAVALEALWGPPAAGSVTTSDEEGLLDQAWQDGNLLALIPFEALEPRWKALTVGGMSPVHIGFDMEAYPLVVPFGLSGDAQAIAALQEASPWPESNLDPDRMTVLVMTGVTALTRATAAKMDNRGMTYPAEAIGSWLQQADITHVSHEVSFTAGCPPPDPNDLSGRFCSSPRHMELLEYVGVDVVELTGDHLNDWGRAAMLESLGLYDEQGWPYFGGGANLEESYQPVFLEHNGNRFAFLGCNINRLRPPQAWATVDSPGATPCDMDMLLDQVTQLRQQGHLPIFTFQWTEEYQPNPSPAQQQDFREAVDAGAVIVSGSQAHQPQGFEFYEGSFIHYGLGNLFFDQMWSLQVRQEFIDRHVFYEGRHISTVLHTALLEDWSRPRPMTEAERQAFLETIFDASGW